MISHSQFRLLAQRRFLPFYLTQFSGAFNDNLYKNALLLLITYSAGPVLGLSLDLVVNLAAFLFILPFFLFSGIAGQVADHYEMSAVIRVVKLAEILIMAVAAVGLWLGWWELLLVLLFLMGTQSTFFGPVKYAILPKVLADDELVGGNGLVGMGTFVAILLGTIAAGLIAGLEQAARIAAVCVLLMAVAGYLAARQVPRVGADSPQLVVRLRPLRETWRLMHVAVARPHVLRAVLAISWFWFLGAAYLTQFPNFAKTWLGGDATVVTLLLALFTIGIAIGSMLCERLTRHRISLVPVPWGALGLTLFGVDVYLAVPEHPAPSDWWQLLTQLSSLRLLLDLTAIGICGGLFIVPLYAYIQHHTPAPSRARIIAALNVINALFMVISALSAMLLLGIAGMSIPGFFLTLSLLNMLVLPVVVHLHRQEALRSVDKYSEK